MDNEELLKSLRIRFPSLSEKDLEEADARLTEYVRLALQIYEEICNDPVRYEKLRKDLEERQKEEKNPD